MKKTMISIFITLLVICTPTPVNATNEKFSTLSRNGNTVIIRDNSTQIKYKTTTVDNETNIYRISESGKEVLFVTVISSEIEMIEDIHSTSFPTIQSFENSSYAVLATTSPYDVWQANWMSWGSGSQTFVWYKGVIVTQDLVWNSFILFLTSLFNPSLPTVTAAVKATITGIIVGNIIVNTVKNSISTIYFTKKIRNNVFCPILAKVKYDYYNSPSLTGTSGYISSSATDAEWFGDPQSYDQPFYCRDLDLIY